MYDYDVSAVPRRDFIHRTSYITHHTFPLTHSQGLDRRTPPLPCRDRDEDERSAQTRDRSQPTSKERNGVLAIATGVALPHDRHARTPPINESAQPPEKLSQDVLFFPQCLANADLLGRSVTLRA